MDRNRGRGLPARPECPAVYCSEGQVEPDAEKPGDVLLIWGLA